LKKNSPFVNNVGKGAEVDAETKALIAKAEQGDALAQSNLGAMYANGRGVPKDMVNAYAWLNVASANGNEIASERRDGNARFMTPEQIAEAQKLSKVWFEKFQPKE
jgi:TPR repeat protein